MSRSCIHTLVQVGYIWVWCLRNVLVSALVSVLVSGASNFFEISEMIDYV